MLHPFLDPFSAGLLPQLAGRQTLLAATDAAASTSLVAPWLILILCIVAGLATAMLLPGYRIALRRTAGVVVAACFVVLAVVLFRGAGYTNIYFWVFAAIALGGSVRVITHPKPVYSALWFVLTVFASAGLFVLMYAEFMAAALIVIYAGAILVTYTFVIMLAADAAPPQVGPDGAIREFLAEHDANARAPWLASAVGFATMGLLLFVVFEKAPAVLVPRLSLTQAQYMLPPEPDARGGVQGDVASAPTVVLDAPQEGDVDEDTTEDFTAAGPVGVLRGDLYAANEQPGYAQERGSVQTLGIYLFTRQLVTLQVAGLLLTVAMIGAIVIARKQVIVDQPDLADEGVMSTYSTPATPVNDNPHSLPVHGTGRPRQKAYPQN